MKKELKCLAPQGFINNFVAAQRCPLSTLLQRSGTGEAGGGEGALSAGSGGTLAALDVPVSRSSTSLAYSAYSLCCDAYTFVVFAAEPPCAQDGTYFSRRDVNCILATQEFSLCLIIGRGWVFDKKWSWNP